MSPATELTHAMPRLVAEPHVFPLYHWERDGVRIPDVREWKRPGEAELNGTGPNNGSVAAIFRTKGEF